jgi:hypothetical protein
MPNLTKTKPSNFCESLVRSIKASAFQQAVSRCYTGDLIPGKYLAADTRLERLVEAVRGNIPDLQSMDSLDFLFELSSDQSVLLDYGEILEGATRYTDGIECTASAYEELVANRALHKHVAYRIRLAPGAWLVQTWFVICQRLLAHPPSVAAERVAVWVCQSNSWHSARIVCD